MQQKEKIPYALILQKTQLRLLWYKAKNVGFTKDGIRHLLRFVNMNPYTMTTADLFQVMPYVNGINAKQFNPQAKRVWPEAIAFLSHEVQVYGREIHEAREHVLCDVGDRTRRISACLCQRCVEMYV